MNILKNGFLFALWCGLFMHGTTFAGFNFSHETSTFRFGQNTSTLYLSENITGWNGTLNRGLNGTISNATSKTIGFSNGFFENNGVKSKTTSTYTPAGTYEIILADNQFIQASPGQILQSMKISGSAKIEGQPRFSSAIVFDPSTTLSIGLQSKLNKNIQFDASGTNTVYMIDDLKLADGVTIVNEGTVDVGGKSFWFGGQTLTMPSKIYWKNAGDINLGARWNLSAEQAILDETTINGHGNVIDLSGGGFFSLAASTTLYLTDVTLLGLTDSSFVFGDAGSTVRMSNVTVQVANNTTWNTGLLYFDAPSTIYLPNNNNWTFGGSSNLTVSGVTVWKDETGAAPTGDVLGNLTMVYNGTIKEVATKDDIIVSDLAGRVDDLLRFIHGPRNFSFGTNMTLTVDIWPSADHVFSITGAMILDGNKHAITFAKNEPAQFVVGTNSLAFTDVTLKSFTPSAVSLSSTGTLIFGDQTTIEMTDNNALTSANYTMSCDGFVRLNCFGNELDISQMSEALDVLPGSTLAIYNARIKGLGGSTGSGYLNNIRCLGPDATLTLSNCELMLESDYSFTEGFLNIYQDVEIRGPEKPSGTSLVFAYQSPQVATVNPVAKLMVDRYVTFSYDPVTPRKDLLTLADATSIFHLRGCTLYSTHTGLELTGGRLIVEDKVTVNNEAVSQAEAMVLKNPLDIDVLSGGIFDLVGGLVDYQ